MHRFPGMFQFIYIQTVRIVCFESTCEIVEVNGHLLFMLVSGRLLNFTFQQKGKHLEVIFASKRGAKIVSLFKMSINIIFVNLSYDFFPHLQ